MKKVLLTVLSILISSCSSVPLGTLAKLGTFDQQDFLALAPTEISARIQLEEPAKLMVDRTDLALKIDTNKGATTYQFPLDLLSETVIPSRESLFSPTPGQTEYTFKLADNAVSNFQHLQDTLAHQAPERFDFTVNADVEDLPDSVSTVTLTVLLKLSDRETYFPLLEDAEVDIHP
ncbi:hypothetical protein [Marinobacter xestospongiae]|uniref:Lipoprotein n=1 Tax=Marinobacter xestospongiae TaxID=994319 RepID=A0ABU3VY46_9GAMM|nr:hypothetical protein [Marinobacter xestospongiae]MDV2079164.1 hypothetical protein [Marinobacter xestospongiae]